MLIVRRFAGPALLAICLSAVASGGVPVQPVPEARPRTGGTLLVKAYQAPFNPVFDPSTASHYFIIEQLYDGLVKFDNNFLVIPSLADYWTISDDGTRITFNLRKNVRFHNGRVMTAEDVKFSLERLCQNRPENVCWPYFVPRVAGAREYWEGKARDVSGFRVIDPETFEIQWTRPYVSSLGLNLLAMYYCKILPKDLLEEQGSRFFQHPVGTGPFRFDYWIRSPKFGPPDLEILGVRLERFVQYFGKKPYLDALEYSPYFRDDDFEAGEVHIIPVTSESLLHKRFQILENGSLRSASLALSCHLAPLDRPEVRRALALGLDRKALAAAIATPDMLPQVTDNFIPPLLPGFFPKDASPVYEPDKARMLLARLLPESGGRLTLTLVLLLPRREAQAGLARELGRELGALGIGLEVKYLKAAEDIRSVRVPYMKFVDWTMDFPDPENIILPLYGSQSPANRLGAHYGNARLDALLEQSEVETSWERRTALFRQMEKILFEDMPAVPLCTQRVRIALLPSVRGAKLPALGFFFLDVKEIWIEKKGASGGT